MATVDETTGQDTELTDSEVLDAIEPRGEARTWTIGHPDFGGVETFVQRPLGFFSKMEWYSLVSAAVDEMIQSDGGEEIGQTIASVFVGGVDFSGPQGMSDMVAALVKLTAAVPDFLRDSYCIWLGVPREKRAWARAAMEASPDEGGLADDDGVAILETFIDQNVEAIRGFFAVEGPKLWTRLQLRLDRGPKPSLKPSKRTAPRTPRR